MVNKKNEYHNVLVCLYVCVISRTRNIQPIVIFLPCSCLISIVAVVVASNSQCSKSIISQILSSLIDHKFYIIPQEKIYRTISEKNPTA